MIAYNPGSSKDKDTKHFKGKLRLNIEEANKRTTDESTGEATSTYLDVRVLKQLIDIMNERAQNYLVR